MTMNKKAAVDLLKGLMSKLSEDYWCAGWLDGIEYMLWNSVTGGKQSPYSADEISQLKELSQECEGWVVWDDESQDQKFIEMNEWLKRYRDRT